jgi:hypothetical protein
MELVLPPVLFTVLTWGIVSLAVVREKGRERERHVLFNTPGQSYPAPSPAETKAA